MKMELGLRRFVVFPWGHLDELMCVGGVVNAMEPMEEWMQTIVQGATHGGKRQDILPQHEAPPLGIAPLRMRVIDRILHDGQKVSCLPWCIPEQ